METTINKWKYFKMNLCERIFFLKIYVIGLVQYQLKAFAIPGRYLRKMNMLMFKYVWNSRWEKIERKILVGQVNNGGLNMIDLKKEKGGRYYFTNHQYSLKYELTLGLSLCIQVWLIVETFTP